LKILNYKAVDRIGKSKRKLYCWNLESNLYFQAGCFFGKKDELLEKVEKEYGIESEYHLAVDFLEKLITFKIKEMKPYKSEAEELQEQIERNGARLFKTYIFFLIFWPIYWSFCFYLIKLMLS
jgi:hypothetical protein